MELVGVGAALLDYLLHISDAYLETIPGEKYGMELVDEKAIISIIEKSGSVPSTMAGGSAANVIKSLASLGWDVSLVGKIGNDPRGELLEEHLDQLGVNKRLISSSIPTGTSLSLISGHGKRTLRTFMGASQTFTAEDFDVRYLAGARLVHIEAYTLYSDPKLTERVMKLAKQQGSLLSFDLGSFEVVKQFHKEIHFLLQTYVDIVFANEDEAREIKQTSNHSACDFLRSLVQVAIVMQGADGCLVGDPNGVKHYPAFTVEAIDTTGAGDLFAAGFLHGYLKGMPLEMCAKIGALLGSAVVLEIGAEIPKTKWASLLNHMKCGF
ncbi:MAG: adenosine kinase [Waddliaceae bacterium]